MEYNPGNIIYVPLYVTSIHPLIGQTIKLSDFDLRDASTTPLESYLEVEILETTSTTAKLDDNIDDIGIILTDHLVQIKSYKISEKATKYFVTDYDGEKIIYKKYAHEISDKIKLCDCIKYGIFKANKYDHRGNEYIIYEPELLMKDVTIKTFNELKRNNFQLITQLTSLKIA